MVDVARYGKGERVRMVAMTWPNGDNLFFRKRHEDLIRRSKFGTSANHPWAEAKRSEMWFIDVGDNLSDLVVNVGGVRTTVDIETVRGTL